MARVKVSRELALKGFVTSLLETFGGGDNKVFTRANVEQIGKDNGVGFTMFASQSQGFGKMTRLGQGQYTIPASWMTGKSPWEGDTEVIPVAKVEKTKKVVAADGDDAPKAKRVKKVVEPEVVEVAETITTSVKKNIEKNNKKALTKKELFEKAKAEIAKKKAKTAEATETAE
jgi:hypothetical protein